MALAYTCYNTLLVLNRASNISKGLGRGAVAKPLLHKAAQQRLVAQVDLGSFESKSTRSRQHATSLHSRLVVDRQLEAFRPGPGWKEAEILCAAASVAA